MNLRTAPLAPSVAQSFVASVLAAAEASDRLAGPKAPAFQATPRQGLGEASSVPCAADFGLTAREAGMWGRLRATGLSPKDAADVVLAIREGGVSRE